MFEDMIKAETAAEMLGVTKATLATWRKKKIFLPYYRIGGVIRYKPEDVEAFKNQCLKPIMPEGDE